MSAYQTAVRVTRRWSVLCWMLGLGGVAPVWAQVGGATDGQPGGGAVVQQAAPLSKQELESLVAPIALYPDDLVSQVLMASTYPVEVVQADRWAAGNKSLTGDAMAAALETRSWDPSVRSLVNFPDVLRMMSEKLDWTVKLGDAFIAQQTEVLAAVQTLRARAKEAGNLATTEQQQVKVETGGSSQVIYIQSTSPTVVYVPTYDPVVVYGAWPYPSYPPYYYYPPSYRPGYPGVAFGAGVAMGAAWGYAWGQCDWNRGDINVDVNRNVNISNTQIDRARDQNQINNRAQLNGTRVTSGGVSSVSQVSAWQHDPSHRRGVAYRDAGTAQRFGGVSNAQVVQSRDAFRGRSDVTSARSTAGRAGSGGVGVMEGGNFNTGAGNFNTGGSNVNSGARNFNTGDRNFNTGGTNFNTGGSNFNTGGSNFNTGGSNFNSGPSNFNQAPSGGQATRDYSSRGQASRASTGGGGRGGGGRR